MARHLDDPLPRRFRLFPWLVLFTTPGVERVANLVYAAPGGHELKADVYRPSNGGTGCPVLVEVHGGGWVMGDRRLEARPLMSRLAAHGWVCVSIDYRLSRRATWPDHIADVHAALRWVATNIAGYGGDPDFVVLTGGSAGGHLAALAALAPDEPDHQEPGTSSAPSPRVRACVPFYGVYDFANELHLRTAREMHVMLERPVVKAALAEAPDVYRRASPLARVNEAAPPFLVVQGTSDNLVDPREARAFVERLRSASAAPVAYAEVPGAFHAFDATPSARTAAVIRGVEIFLTHLRAHHHHRAEGTGPHVPDQVPR
jgi:acetyl esterase/lipase